MASGGSKTKIVDTRTPEQQALSQQLGGYLGQNLGQLYNLPVSPLSQAGYNQGDYYGNLLGYGQNIAQNLVNPAYSSQAANLGLQGLQGIMSPFDPSIAGQGLRQGIENALSQTGEIRRSLLEPYAAAGSASSGGAIRALQRAGENVSMGLSQDYLNKLFAGQQSALDRQVSGIGLAGSLAGLPMQLGTGTLGLLGGLQNQLNMEPYMRYQLMSGNIGSGLSGIFGQPGMTAVQQETGPGWLGALGGMAGMALGGPFGGALGNWLFNQTPDMNNFASYGRY